MAKTEQIAIMPDLNMNVEHTKLGLGIGLAALSELTLNDWIQFATFFYLLLQIGLLAPKYYTLFKIWKQKRGSN